MVGVRPHKKILSGFRYKRNLLDQGALKWEEHVINEGGIPSSGGYINHKVTNCGEVG
jgi:hypothetical protein